MTPERRNIGARETAIARQQPCKQATIQDPLLGNESDSTNGGTIGRGVFYVVRAVLYAVRPTAMRLVFDGRQHARTRARRKRNVRC
jgi:hypothetical protein